MPKRKQPAQQKGRQPRRDPAPPARPERRSSSLFVGGLVLSAAAAVASLMLVIEHLGMANLPGCGPESGCAALAASPWGKIPGIGLPVSLFGLAWFIGLHGAWWLTANGVPAPLKWLVRLGVAGSLLLLIGMITEGHFCQYCFLVHLANFGLLAVSELSPTRAARPLMPVATAAGIFVAALAVLVVLDKTVAEEARRQQEEDLRGAIGRAIAGNGGDTGTTPVDNGEPVEEEPFIGRYVLGPEVAPIRIVILSDYQCPDCRNVEQQVRQVMAERDDIAFSAKHFPMCTDCNDHLSRNMHPNACWAARAAEAAGMLRGEEGFWQMHHWLFDIGGAFTDAELTEALRGFGYDVAEFTRVMQGPETLRRVKADIEEGRDLGLHFTPMVFVNGVEMKGITIPGALVNTVQQVAASDPEPRPIGSDQPPMAVQKYIDDWQEKQPLPMRELETAWTTGPATAPVRVVVWGDLQEPNTAIIDQRIRREMQQHGDVRYSFLHYPMNSECNETVQSVMHPLACTAARAVEAAGELQGNDGYWRLHTWLMDNQQGLTAARLLAAAAQQGLDSAAMQQAMTGGAADAAIAEDVTAARRRGVRWIPWIFVNERWLPRWKLEGEDIMGQVFEAARGEGRK